MSKCDPAQFRLQRALEYFSLNGRGSLLNLLTTQEIERIGRISTWAYHFFYFHLKHARTLKKFHKVLEKYREQIRLLEFDPRISILFSFSEQIFICGYRNEKYWQLYLIWAKNIRAGSSKDVYLAFDVCRSQLVALAHIKKNYELATTERNVLAKISHPYIQTIQENFIVRVRSGSGSKLKDLMIMPWAIGGNLCFLKSPNIKFSDIHLYDICVQLANAIYFIHLKRYVHGDIKPENVLFDGNCIKLSDFGSCQKFGEVWNQEGTCSTFPPEVYHSSLTMAPSFDIWCLGLVFYFICTRGTFSSIEKQMDTIWRDKKYGFLENFKNPEWIKSCVILSPKSKFSCLQNLIFNMLKYEPKNRPTILEVIRELAKNRTHMYNL